MHGKEQNFFVKSGQKEICKKLVDLMGGQIRVTSEEGKGSRFSFTAKFDRQVDDLTPKPQFPPEIERIRVLVVNDNRACRKMFENTLQALSCDPVCVKSYVEGYEKPINTQRPYDLIIIDYEMPETNGLKAMEKIRNERRFSQPPIIFMTAFGNEETCRIARGLGADVCIGKPVKFYQLFALTASSLKEEEQKCYDCGMNAYITKPIDMEKLFAVLGYWIQLKRDGKIIDTEFRLFWKR
ncbi:MAG: response regulator [Desulfobacterales bacterium]